MSTYCKTLDFSFNRADALEIVVALLKKHSNGDYYAYEREEVWHVGLGSRAALLIDPKGETATVCTDGKQEVRPVNQPLADLAREFVSQHSPQDEKIYGQVGFNYAAHIRGQAYTPGRWPLLSLMAPRSEVVFHRNHVVVRGPNKTQVTELLDLINTATTYEPPSFINVNMEKGAADYKDRVAKAVSEIKEGQYTKVIASRAVDLEGDLDMPGTLLWGRRQNTPARSFSLSQEGYQATGFSPELVLSLQNGKLITEPLAGTRSLAGTKEEGEQRRRELLADSKEIVEHVLSVKAAMDELDGLCQSGSVVTEDLMSVRKRGCVQHLGSTVAGQILPEKDGWDALAILFPAITASGIPKDPALDAIHRLEARPRELYSGAVLILEGPESFEATLVLRTVFRDHSHQWIQAGAGIIAQSTPERELTETCEKLSSIGPYLVARNPGANVNGASNGHAVAKVLNGASNSYPVTKVLNSMSSGHALAKVLDGASNGHPVATVG